MDTTINFRTNKNLIKQAKKIFSAMGVSTSAGLNMFLHRVVAEQGLPFQPTIDTKKIKRRWDHDAVGAVKKGKRFSSAQDALRDIL